MPDPGKPLNSNVNEQTPPEVAAKLEVIRKAASYSDTPTGDIEDMLAEIEIGYLSQMKIEHE